MGYDKTKIIIMKLNRKNLLLTPVLFLISFLNLGYTNSFPKYSKYNIQQTCRLMRSGDSATNTSINKVPLMLYSNQNPYYDLDAASEYLDLTDPALVTEEEFYNTYLNILAGIIKQCPNKIDPLEIKEIEAMIKKGF